MSDIYGLFLFTLAVIAAAGIGVARLGISPWTLDRVGVAARVIASLTAAGLLSLAFVVDKLSSPTVDLGEFFRNSTARDSLAMVIFLIAAGATGLLAALVLAVFEPPDPVCVSRFARCCRWLRRWAGGCLATASIAVVLLFPATIVLILTAGDAPRGA